MFVLLKSYITLLVTYIHHNLKVLKQKQVELELLEVKLAQKSIAVVQERENNMAEQQCVLL